jgi:tetratricopeptide (TPR) repeat protein
MSIDFLLASEGLFIALYLFLAVVHYVTRSRREFDLSDYQARSFRAFIKHWIVGGTDADLKLEVAYFTALVATAAATHYRRPQFASWPFDGMHAAVAAVLGFHLRLWLSKWRLRNIVFAKILDTQRLIYFKGKLDTLAVLANVCATIYLVRANPSYVFCAFTGFFVQDLTLESRKASQLLRRKLHIFDLEGLPVPQAKQEQLFAAIKTHSARSLRQLVRSADTTHDRVLLHAFALLLHDDFAGFHALLKAEAALIEGDPDLLFYFGKALYALGDVAGARSFLGRGCAARGHDRLCTAYYSLTLIADGGLPLAIDILEEYYRVPGETKGDMFGLGFYALALALSTKGDATALDKKANFEKAFWCINEALRLNESFAKRADLGSLQRHYFLGNEQVLLDIYGYLLFRMGSYVIAFRVLEDAIRQDDTYPWPYYHLALIYSRLDRKDLAKVMYYRVATHERSSTVLRGLCLRRLASLADIHGKTDSASASA